MCRMNLKEVRFRKEIMMKLEIEVLDPVSSFQLHMSVKEHGALYQELAPGEMEMDLV